MLGHLGFGTFMEPFVGVTVGVMVVVEWMGFVGFIVHMASHLGLLSHVAVRDS